MGKGTKRRCEEGGTILMNEIITRATDRPSSFEREGREGSVDCSEERRRDEGKKRGKESWADRKRRGV